MDTINNENKRRKNLQIWLPYLLTIGVFLLVTAFYIRAIIAPFSNSQMAELSDTWVYYSEDDPDTVFKSKYLQRLPNVASNEVMVMERKMTEKPAHPELLIQGDHQWIAVYLDDEQVYSHTESDTHSLNGKNPGKILTELQMPKEYAGKTLRIKISSPYQQYAGLPPRVFIGEADSLMAFVFSVSLTQILILILAVTLGITILIYVGHRLWKKRQLQPELFLFGCFSITVGLESAAGDIVSGLLFSPLINSTLANVCATFIPLFLVSYYCLRMTVAKRYYLMWIIPQICISFIVLGVATFTNRDLPELMSIIDILNVFGTLATSLACIIEATHKNRFFVVCAPWIVLIAIAHCFLYISSVVGSVKSTINWAGLFFIVIMIVITVYTVIEFISTTEKSKQQVNFLEVKTELLEENRNTLINHLQEIKKLRTEFKKNLLTLQQLNLEEKNDEVDKHLHELLADTQTFEGLQTFSEHALTNLLLARYKKLAKQKSITTDFQVNLPEKLAVSDADLTQLFVHLFEHAFRETYAINDPQKRKIILKIQYEENALSIDCEHTAHYHENIFDKGITIDIPEKETFDLLMIESVVAKYSGSLNKYQNEKIDRLEIRLTSE
ncbi:hypothetical protein [Enterococcus mediterraneensis]|uniref:hypothetical protein n=1 Tax=Enterococcus mediterraneensis TaxID=2364791 RepID=UPI000F071189|nr:hypothetical protein [Enterococcus mediterraneensis]